MTIVIVILCYLKFGKRTDTNQQRQTWECVSHNDHPKFFLNSERTAIFQSENKNSAACLDTFP